MSRVDRSSKAGGGEPGVVVSAAGVAAGSDHDELKRTAARPTAGKDAFHGACPEERGVS